MIWTEASIPPANSSVTPCTIRHVLIYVHPANDPLCRLPAGFLNIYTQREVICAITKVDLPDADFEATKAMLMDHGVSGPFFPLGKDRPELLQELVDWLQKE